MTTLINLKMKQWCDLLEEILQCPVCYEIPQNSMYTCKIGHHVCINCKMALTSCPVCKNPDINTRNFLGEDICRNFNIIKKSLIVPKQNNEASIQTENENRSISTQTEELSINENDKNVLNMIITEPKVAKGSYPCRIGSCTQNLPLGRIIRHLRYFHNNDFYEFDQVNGTHFSQKWTLEYELARDHSIALSIIKMGIFFVNINIHLNGDLTAFVEIINSAWESKQFMFKLEIGNMNNAITYSGTVRSCRVSRETLSEQCLYIRNCNMQCMLDKTHSFNCNLTITRKE